MLVHFLVAFHRSEKQNIFFFDVCIFPSLRRWPNPSRALIASHGEQTYCRIQREERNVEPHIIGLISWATSCTTPLMVIRILYTGCSVVGACFWYFHLWILTFWTHSKIQRGLISCLCCGNEVPKVVCQILVHVNFLDISRNSPNGWFSIDLVCFLTFSWHTVIAMCSLFYF